MERSAGVRRRERGGQDVRSGAEALVLVLVLAKDAGEGEGEGEDRCSISVCQQEPALAERPLTGGASRHPPAKFTILPA
jgi:hypothetical protein